MKKGILILNWQKWKFIKHPDIVKTYLKPLYKNHCVNLFEFNPDLEKYLKDQDIEYIGDMYDLHFMQRIPKKK